MKELADSLWAMPAEALLRTVLLVVLALVAAKVLLGVLAMAWFRRQSRKMDERHEAFRRKHGFR